MEYNINDSKVLYFFIGLSEIVLTAIVYATLYYFTVDGTLFFMQNDYLVVFVVTILLGIICLKSINLVRVFRINPHSYILMKHIQSMAMMFTGLILVIFVLQFDISRLFLFSFVVINTLVLYTFVTIIYLIARHRQHKGFNVSNIIIAGDNNMSRIITKIEANNYWGYNIVGIASDEPGVCDKYAGQYHVMKIGDIQNHLLKEGKVDEVIYCSSILDKKEIKDLVYFCLEVGVTFRITSQILDIATQKSEIFYLEETPFFTFQNTPKSEINIFIKNTFDKIFSFFVLLCASPFLLLIAAAIKIDDPKGSVFFKQKRMSIRGREFDIYKFRTMVHNAEELKKDLMDKNEQDSPIFKITNDPRITRVGKFLRKTSIDEFPQFINVLKGEMSVVGPRPPLPKEVEQYEPWQKRRLSMKSGITCIWQVSGRNNIPFEQWVKLDLQYIDTWSIGLDFMIILKTIKTVIKHDGK